MNDRREQASFRVNGDPQVDLVVVGHFLGLSVVGRIDIRVGNERFDNGLREEGEVSEVNPVLLLERGFRRLAQCSDIGHIDLVDLR